MSGVNPRAASGVEPAPPRLRPVQHQVIELEGEPRHVLSDPAGYAEPIALSTGAVVVAQHLDGTRSVEDVVAGVREAGLVTTAEVVTQLVEGLDAAGYLASSGFEALREGANLAYRTAGVRPACFAGESYPADAPSLRRELDARFDAVRDDAARARWRGRTPRGIVSPHIDLRVAELTYARAYAPFANGAAAPDLFVVFGTAHALVGEPFVASSVPYDTPLGAVPTDAELLDAIAGRTRVKLFEDEAAHRAEHSVEFQAVQLRYLFGDTTPPMLAFLTGALEDPDGDGGARSFVDELREVVEADGRRVCYVAGGDLAHLGPRFDDADEAIGEGHLRALETADRETLTAVARGDAAAFRRSVLTDDNARRICGLAPIDAVLRCTRDARGHVEGYRQWLEDGSVVSFAALTIGH